jgi:hypothetical protein
VPRDRYHIVGHGQLQPYNRTDPGRNWPWSHYMSRINAHCGGGGGGTTPPAPPTGGLVIDSNNARNDRAKGYIALSGNWAATSSTSGYYGTGYYYASTQPVSDGASFYFYATADGAKTIDAWWTAGTNRAAAAPFIAFDPAGREVGRATANQQINGKKWVQLGRWNFKRGWNRVVLSRWTTEGKVVVADAVRVR